MTDEERTRLVQLFPPYPTKGSTLSELLICAYSNDSLAMK
jgi:hypothetical protein